MAPLILLAVAVLLCSSITQGQDMDRRRVETSGLGLEARLNCRYNDSIRDQFMHWVLPDLVTIDSNYINHSIQYHYLTSNNDLFISYTRYQHLGRYLCYHGNPPKYMYSEVHLHLPPLWDTYRMNVIIGCSAAAIVALIFIVSCLVYHMKYGQEDHYQEQIDEGFGKKIDQGFGNPGFIEEPIKSSPSMKRYDDVGKQPIEDSDSITKM